MDNFKLMDDPFFAGIMFKVESIIHDADRAAADKGMELKDSHIKSCLSKVKKLAKGGRPAAMPKTEKEKFILQLAQDIDRLRSEIGGSSDTNADFEDAMQIRTADWLIAVKAIEDSLKTRTAAGSRYYLDFLTGFIAEAREEELGYYGDQKTKWWTRIFRTARRALSKRM